MALMLIDSRDHEPAQPTPRRRRDIDWPLAWWGFESVGLFVAAASLGGLIGVALAFAAFFGAVKALEVFTRGSGFGLHDHRQ